MAVSSRSAIAPQLPTSAAGFLIKFCAIFFVLEYGYWLLPDTFLRDTLYAKGLVAPCVAGIHSLSPGEPLIAKGSVLLAGSVSLEVVRGCDGAGAIFLLVAAILAVKAPIQQKAYGLILGVGLLLLVNSLRIMALYFIAAYQPTWFVVSHAYWAPTLMVMIGCLFFARWRQTCETLAL